MKKLWLPILIVSITVSTLCVFYVAVGAAAQEEEPKLPDGVIFEPTEEQTELMLLQEKLSESEVPLYSVKDGPLTLRLLDSEYEGEGLYEMDYTVEAAYLSDTLPEGIETKNLADREGISAGVLEEGYTFLCVDVIIENKGTEKQMYLVNSATVSGYGLAGFRGQRFKNTAALHTELYPDEPFETTLVFAVKKDKNEVYQLIINNFGYGSPNGTCAYIDLEIEK